MPILSLEHSPNNLLRNSLGVKQGIRPSILKSQIPNKVGPSEIPCNKHKVSLRYIIARNRLSEKSLVERNSHP